MDTDCVGDVIAHCEQGKHAKVLHQCAKDMHCTYYDDRTPTQPLTLKIFCSDHNPALTTPPPFIWETTITGLTSPTPAPSTLTSSVVKGPYSKPPVFV